jgi:subtilisin family serine protease
MASPHVAGVAALYLEGHSGTAQQVRDAIVAAATSGVVSNAGRGSPNLLLYSLIP